MERILFFIFGFVAVFGSIMVVSRRHPISSVMYLLLTLFSVAALFVLRKSHFIAAIQIIVYAGAVVVLIVFVIMLLNVAESKIPVERPTLAQGVGVVAAGLLMLEGALVGSRYGAQIEKAVDVGTVEAVGKALFTSYLLPFEITSLLLLAAIVGSIVLARKKF
ncbi:MAG: NADH-quinone oxidoreductase subunit J [Deltaproteobacteria bacterium]|nr:MAG: NADH-quinone oxidoreductase subunit J [Deltaproteobacteria bacterium]